MSTPINVVLQGDCLEVLRTLDPCSVDSVVTDPPAGIEFMGAEWDTFKRGRLTTYTKPMTPAEAERGEEQSFRERMTANPSFHQKANARCATCQRYRFSGTPCRCEEPDWELDNSTRDTFIAFMREVMKECLRVLKPGGHALVWAIPRTSHWTATALEDAGFEIRDSILHIFGQGFPKSLNVSKAIDKAAGAKRKVVKAGRGFDADKNKHGQFDSIRPSNVGVNTAAFNARIGEVTLPATPEAEAWEGWGTQLKPAVEVWWLCRKPLVEKNVISQVLKTGTGALNIDEARVGTGGDKGVWPVTDRSGRSSYNAVDGSLDAPAQTDTTKGRWPANVVLSHGLGCQRVGTREVEAPTINRFTDGAKPFGGGAGHPYESSGGGTEEQPVYECEPGCPVAALNEQSGDVRSAGKYPTTYSDSTGYGGGVGKVQGPLYDDAGGAARFFQTFEPDYDVPFFYTGKASKKDKNAFLEVKSLLPALLEPKAKLKDGEWEAVATELEKREIQPWFDGTRQYLAEQIPKEIRKHFTPVRTVDANTHPTVKSQSLMTYLVRLVTPKGGLVLDPFAGSGSTLVAAATEGYKFLGIEREERFHRIASIRSEKALARALEGFHQRAAFNAMAELPED